MQKNRVVITGLGVISSIGTGVETFENSLFSGKGGIGRISYFNVDDFPSKIAGQVKDYKVEDHFSKKEARRLDKFVQFALVAAREAVRDCGLDLGKIDRERAGVYVGSGIGGLWTIEEQLKNFFEKGPRGVSPFLIPMIIIDMASGQISIEFGFKGPNSASVTACASGSHSIGDAFRLIEQGRADLMVTGGTEAGITLLSLAGFSKAKALSTRNDDPTRASRPFDLKRDGFVISEGAGIIVLEELNHAISRKAKIYAEIVGYGMTGDAYHITAPAPGGEGGVRAMKAALADANIVPSEIDYINAHGTSTPLNDKGETQAIKTVFGEAAYKIPISSTKSMTGHALGASGGIEFIATCLMIKKKMIHPTINYEYPDPDCDLDYVPNKPREKEIRYALSNSFGFGGHNAVLIIKKFEEE